MNHPDCPDDAYGAMEVIDHKWNQKEKRYDVKVRFEPWQEYKDDYKETDVWCLLRNAITDLDEDGQKEHPLVSYCANNKYYHGSIQEREFCTMVANELCDYASSNKKEWLPYLPEAVFPEMNSKAEHEKKRPHEKMIQDESTPVGNYCCKLDHTDPTNYTDDVCFDSYFDIEAKEENFPKGKFAGARCWMCIEVDQENKAKEGGTTKITALPFDCMKRFDGNGNQISQKVTQEKNAVFACGCLTRTVESKSWFSKLCFEKGFLCMKHRGVLLVKKDEAHSGSSRPKRQRRS